MKHEDHYVNASMIISRLSLLQVPRQHEKRPTQKARLCLSSAVPWLPDTLPTSSLHPGLVCICCSNPKSVPTGDGKMRCPWELGESMAQQRAWHRSSPEVKITRKVRLGGKERSRARWSLGLLTCKSHVGEGTTALEKAGNAPSKS